MPELKKIEASAAYTPESGKIVEYLAEEDGKIVIKVKKSDGTEQTLSGGGAADVTLGQIDADGNFQPLAFNGTEASNSGSPETVENYYGWNGVLPSPSGGIKVIQGGSAVYYKCASVDTANKTWTGYLAVPGEDGAYSFEETATTGLTYGTAYTPKQNSIYNNDATIRILELWDGSLIPKDDLTFYASLFSESTVAETGQNIVARGNVTYNTINGIGSAIFDRSSRIETASDFDIYGNTPVTLSAWIKADGTNTTTSAVNIGSNSDRCMLGIGESEGRAFVTGYAADYTSNIFVNDRMHHIAATYADDTITLYVDGILIHSYSATLNISRSTVSIGSAHGSYYFHGAVSSVRIYSRVLIQDEITALANEFTPTA